MAGGRRGEVDGCLYDRLGFCFSLELLETPPELAWIAALARADRACLCCPTMMVMCVWIGAEPLKTALPDVHIKQRATSCLACCLDAFDRKVVSRWRQIDYNSIPTFVYSHG